MARFRNVSEILRSLAVQELPRLVWPPKKTKGPSAVPRCEVCVRACATRSTAGGVDQDVKLLGGDRGPRGGVRGAHVDAAPARVVPEEAVLLGREQEGDGPPGVVLVRLKVDHPPLVVQRRLRPLPQTPEFLRFFRRPRGAHGVVARDVARRCALTNRNARKREQSSRRSACSRSSERNHASAIDRRSQRAVGNGDDAIVAAAAPAVAAPRDRFRRIPQRVREHGAHRSRNGSLRTRWANAQPQCVAAILRHPDRVG